MQLQPARARRALRLVPRARRERRGEGRLGRAQLVPARLGRLLLEELLALGALLLGQGYRGQGRGSGWR